MKNIILRVHQAYGEIYLFQNP